MPRARRMSAGYSRGRDTCRDVCRDLLIRRLRAIRADGGAAAHRASTHVCIGRAFGDGMAACGANAIRAGPPHPALPPTWDGLRTRMESRIHASTALVPR